MATLCRKGLTGLPELKWVCPDNDWLDNNAFISKSDKGISIIRVFSSEVE